MRGLFSAIVPDSLLARVRRVLVTHMGDEDDQENEKEDERRDGKQRVESGRESSNTQHERMDGMTCSARDTLFLSQCQCDNKSVVNQRENVACKVCCSQGSES